MEHDRPVIYAQLLYYFVVKVQMNIRMMKMSAGKFEEQQQNA